MRAQRLGLIGMCLLTAVSCGPGAADDSDVSSTAEAVDVTVNAPLVDPSSVNVTFQFQPPTQWQALTQELQTIAGPFSQIASVIGSINTAVSAAEVVLRFLGILSSPPDQFKQLSDHIDQVTTALSWQMNGLTVDGYMAQLESALQQIQIDTDNGVQFSDSDSNSFWKGSMDAMNFLEGVGGVTGLPFLRAYADSITNDPSNWKGIIPAVTGWTRPSVDPNNLVYDWRLHVPALLKAIPERLAILAAAEPNFKTTGIFNTLLTNDRRAILDNYQKMYAGIVCGSQNYPVFSGTKVLAYGCKVACADMYTGFSGSNSIPPILSSDGGAPVSGCVALASTPDFKYDILEIHSGINKRLPFYNMRALADNLYRTMHPAPDLTELNQRISLEANQSLCVEIESGNAADGTPVWLAPCTGSTLQWWSYDRISGRIWNPGLNKCLSAQISGRAAEATSPPSPGEPLSLYIYPAVVATCDSTLPEQKWTYDPEHEVLQNGIGPEASLTAATSGVHATLMVRGLFGEPQWFHPTNRWHADSASITDNHPLIAASGSVAGGGIAVDAQGVYWGNNNGNIEKTNLGQALSTADLATGQSKPWAVAVDANNVYWTNFLIGGTVMKMSKRGDGPGPITISAETGRPAGIAVDSTGVYYTNSTYQGTAGTGTIKKASLNGGGVVTLASGQLDPEYIAVDSTSVYWTNFGASASVMKVNKNGGTVVTLASGQSFPTDIKVDATSVYWLNNGSGQVMKVPLNGGAAVVLASGQPTPINLAVDSSGVYWDNNVPGGAVLSVGLNGGTPVVLAEGLNRPALMATDATYAYFGTNDIPGTIQRVAKLHPNLAAIPAPPPSCASGTLLASGQGLIAGTPQAIVTTCDGRYFLAMQLDGNFVFYQSPTTAGGNAIPVWASNTVGSFGDRAIMQADGNLVVYNDAGSPVWNSGTAGQRGATLITDGSGHLFISNGRNNVWGTTGPSVSTNCGSLKTGQGLRTGASLVSCNGRFLLTMQADGNLVLYDNLAGPIWASGTSGAQLYVNMTVGSLQIWQPGATAPIWSSNAIPSSAVSASLTLSNTGNIVIIANEGSLFGVTFPVIVFTSNSGTSAVNFGSLASDVNVWTTFTSDEFAPIACGPNTAVNGVGCASSYCDNITLQCSTVPMGVTLGATGTTAFFSEEKSTVSTSHCVTYSDGTSSCQMANGNQGFCSGGVMVGIAASGSFSDNIELKCAKLATGHLDDGTHCVWTVPLSEEQGSQLINGSFSANGTPCTGDYCDMFVKGVECSGSNCDNMRYYACPIYQ